MSDALLAVLDELPRSRSRRAGAALPSRELPTDRRGVYTDVTEAGLKLVGEAGRRATPPSGGAFDQAAANPELASWSRR